MLSDDNTTRARLPTDLARCRVCGYRAVLHDGLFIHETAALFTVLILGCNNPDPYPFTHDSQPTLSSSRQPYTPITCGRSPDMGNLLRATAIGVLNTHTNTMGQCPVCGFPWPCQPAVAAEHHLAAL